MDDCVREFWCFWIESRQEWHVMLGDTKTLGPFPAIGYAVGATLRLLGRGEVEFECTLDSGECYHYEADDEFWQN